MERHWSVVCVLVVALCAYLHFDTASADEADGCSTGRAVWTETESETVGVFFFLFKILLLSENLIWPQTLT